MNEESQLFTFQFESKELAKLCESLVRKGGWQHLHDKILSSVVNQEASTQMSSEEIANHLVSIAWVNGTGFAGHKDRLEIPSYRLSHINKSDLRKFLSYNNKGDGEDEGSDELDDGLISVTRDRAIFFSVTWNHTGVTSTSLKTYGFPMGWICRTTLVPRYKRHVGSTNLLSECDMVG